MIVSSLTRDANIASLLRREHRVFTETRASRLYGVMLRGFFKVGREPQFQQFFYRTAIR